MSSSQAGYRANARIGSEAVARVWPGMDNYEVAVNKITTFGESKTLELRFETFNAFNHTQFFGGSAGAGNINSATFGRVLHAASRRIVQLGPELSF